MEMESVAGNCVAGNCVADSVIGCVVDCVNFVDDVDPIVEQMDDVGYAEMFGLGFYL